MSRTPFDENNDVSEAPESGDPKATGPVSIELDELQRLQTERDELFDRLARTQAEFVNSRRRLEADLDQRVQYANTNLIKSLLPVIDSFERGLSVEAEKADADTILKGMQIVHDQLMKVLKEHFVDEIAPEPGTPFDPAKHEALLQHPSDEYDQPTVTQLLQKGYALRDRTIRPAQVAVSKTS